MASTDARGIETRSSDEATDMTPPTSWACAQNHAAELLKKPEELGWRTRPHSRAAEETHPSIEGETTQAHPTELLTKLRRPREARKPQSSRWTDLRMHIRAAYKYCIGLHCIVPALRHT